MWGQLVTYCRSLKDHGITMSDGTGLYAMAHTLWRRSPPFLQGRSLGEVCHIIQLAASRQLLGDAGLAKKVQRLPGIAARQHAPNTELCHSLWDLLDQSYRPGMVTVSALECLTRSHVMKNSTEILDRGAPGDDGEGERSRTSSKDSSPQHGHLSMTRLLPEETCEIEVKNTFIHFTDDSTRSDTRKRSQSVPKDLGSSKRDVLKDAANGRALLDQSPLGNRAVNYIKASIQRRRISNKILPSRCCSLEARQKTRQPPLPTMDSQTRAEVHHIQWWQFFQEAQQRQASNL